MRQEHAFQISIGDMSEAEEEREVFNVRNIGTRPYEANDRIHSAVAIEMNLDRKIIMRQHYTILDWFSSLGGLLVASFIILSMIFFIFTLNMFENYLVNQLFRGDYDLA